MPRKLITAALPGQTGVKFSDLAGWAYEGQAVQNISLNTVNSRKYSTTPWYGLSLYGGSSAPGQYFYKVNAYTNGRGTVALTYPYNISANSVSVIPLYIPSVFTTMQLTATPTAGYSFLYWRLNTPDGTTYNTNASVSIAYTESMLDTTTSIYAVFGPIIPPSSAASSCAYSWSLDNLTVTTYRDNTPISNITDPTQWRTALTGAYFRAFSDSVLINRQHRFFYNSFALDDPRGLAPVGCRVATVYGELAVSDWSDLISCLGGTATAGNTLKERDLSGGVYWTGVNNAHTNTSLLSVRSSGYRAESGSATIVNSATAAYYRNGRGYVRINYSNSSVDFLENAGALTDTSLGGSGLDVYDLIIYPNPSSPSNASLIWQYYNSLYNYNRVSIESSANSTGPWNLWTTTTRSLGSLNTTDPLPTSGVKWWRITSHDEPYFPPVGYFEYTNTSSITVPTSTGNISFNAGTGKLWQTGQNINITTRFEINGTRSGSSGNSITILVSSYTTDAGASPASHNYWAVTNYISPQTTSTTPINLPVAPLSTITITTASPLPFGAGNIPVRLRFQLDFSGTVVSYNSFTGTLTMNVTSISNPDSISGTWNIPWKFFHVADNRSASYIKRYPGDVGDVRTGMPVRYIIPTVTVGSRTWMSVNLDVTQYRNGDVIPQATNATEWATATTGTWCWYGFDYSLYGTTYGKLYNWYAVSDPRGLAPTGWHIPSDYEWGELSDSLGGLSVSGDKMKAGYYWSTFSGGTVGSSNYRALPGGKISAAGTFSGITTEANFWSNTSIPNTDGNYFSYRLQGNSAALTKLTTIGELNGYSVRCIKDSEGPIQLTLHTSVTQASFSRFRFYNTLTGEIRLLENLERFSYLSRTYNIQPGTYEVSLEYLTGSLTSQIVICDDLGNTLLINNSIAVGATVSYNLTAVFGRSYVISIAINGSTFRNCQGI